MAENKVQTWRERAPEIREMLEQGKTVMDIALKYGVRKKTAGNRIGELKAKGLLDGQLIPDAETPTRSKRTLERHKDGSYTSERDKMWLRNDMIYDDEYILTQHGFNPDDWEIVNVRHNQWENYSKKAGITELFASKVTVKPKTQKWKFEDLLNAVNSTPAIHIPDSFTGDATDRLLELPFYDTHFGISDLEYYRETQHETLDYLRDKKWEQVEITIGQDLLHNDNFQGTTAKGTPIEVVDMPSAWEDAVRFYAPIFAVAKKQSKSVKVIYSKGNHDESMSWAFVKNLRSLFPWAKYDIEVEERKVHMFHQCFIGITHGEKTPPKELVTLFATEFPQQWAQAVTREIHKGHWHKEDANDDYGSMVRTLATRNKTDQWHKNRGFTRAHKRFQIFEWDHNELKDVHYV